MTISNNQIQLTTARFRLETLTEASVSEQYLSWFTDTNVKKYIVTARNAVSLESLQKYVREKDLSNDALLFGIYALDSGQHIGNIKYEPVNPDTREAVMGVLIGDPAWRGKGVFGEVYAPTAELLNKSWGITHIWLGVETENTAAVSAYQKHGYVEQEPPQRLFPQKQPHVLHMVDVLENRPSKISKPLEQSG